MPSDCPRCGAQVPSLEWEGLCPRCIARVSLSPEPEPVMEAEEVPGPIGTGAAAAFPTGFRLGDYELLEEIGRGGMGVVYRARQLSLDRLVAVKTILSGRLADPDAVRRFRAEAGALARLRHPHIVTIHEITESEGHHLFSMEYVPGGNLAQRLQEAPPGTAGSDGARQKPTDAATLLAKVADAVHHAHERGVLHRDLKPSNILIDAAGEPHVTDFGLAKRLHAQSDLTYTGQLIGSPQYFAPEQFSPRFGEIGPRTDVFALGAVLYHLLTGRPPRHGETLEAVLLQLIDAVVVSPRKCDPTLPRDLDTICLKCLEPDPRHRYATAAAVAEDLRRFLAGQPILARPCSPARRLIHVVRRHPAPTLALLVVAASLGFTTWLANRGPAPRTVTTGPRTGPATTAMRLRDGEFDPAGWRLEVAASGTGTVQTAGRVVSADGKQQWLAVTNRLVGAAQVIGFHFPTNAQFNPAWRGPIRSVGLRVSARQIDGVAGAQVGVCLKQAGRRYLAPPATMEAGTLGWLTLGPFAPDDFRWCDGVRLRAEEHPDFSARAAPIEFGLTVLDADAGPGHFGWAIVDDFELTVNGRTPEAFPMLDEDFKPGDWSLIVLGERGADTVASTTRTARAGHALRLESRLPAGTSLFSCALSERSLYDPSQQGPLAAVTIRLELREQAESVGRQVNPTVLPVATQRGRLFVGRKSRIAAYTAINDGWEEIRFDRLPATELLERLGDAALGPAIDFSTNGAPIRFGFAFTLTTAFRQAGGGFSTTSAIRGFRVEVEPARDVTSGTVAR